MLEHQPSSQHHPAIPLHDQVAILTGASQGIGHALALRLAHMGIHLMLAARNRQKLEALKAEILALHPAIRCVIHTCDIRDVQQVQAVVDETVKTFGRLDILINNAGVAPHVGLFQEASIEDIDRTIDTNLKGSMYFMRAAIPHMVQQHHGTVININSIAGKTAYPFWSVYDASKFGLRAVTEAVAEEQRVNNIKVVGIYPGTVDTPIWEDVAMENEPNREGMLEPEHVADTVAFILNQPQKVFIKEIVLEPLKPVF